MILAENNVLMLSCTLQKNVTIGFKSYANDSFIGANTVIGRYCSIGRGCTIAARKHNVDWLTTHPLYNDPAQERRHPFLAQWPKAKTNIGNDVWIGDNVIVLEGISIGDGAVVGAGAVVSKNVEPYDIVGGVPARRIRRRFSDKISSELLVLRWWEFTIDILDGLPIPSVEECLPLIAHRIASGQAKLPPHHRKTKISALTQRQTSSWKKLKSVFRERMSGGHNQE